MRQLRISIEEDLDEALQAESAGTGGSKAALIRECVSSRYSEAVAIENDPLTALVGTVDAEPAAVDDVAYG